LKASVVGGCVAAFLHRMRTEWTVVGRWSDCDRTVPGFTCSRNAVPAVLQDGCWQVATGGAGKRNIKNTPSINLLHGPNSTSLFMLEWLHVLNDY
jgi:hypothetical protein